MTSWVNGSHGMEWFIKKLSWYGSSLHESIAVGLRPGFSGFTGVHGTDVMQFKEFMMRVRIRNHGNVTRETRMCIQFKFFRLLGELSVHTVLPHVLLGDS